MFIIMIMKKNPANGDEFISYAWICLIKTLDDIVSGFKSELRKEKLIIIDQTAVSKAYFFRQILLYGNNVALSKEQRDIISRTVIFLKPDSTEHFQEPLIVEGIKRCLTESGESAIGLLNLKGQDIVLSGGIKSSPKGFWAEFVFSTVLIQIAKYLGGKPITSHPMFSNLNGTIFDKYTIDVNEPLFSPDGWQTLLTPTIGPNGEITIVNTNLIALQLDLNLRWDIFVLLKKCCNVLENIPTYTFMIVNSKLECDISCDDFCNNILASQPENGYINATGKILNVEKKEITKYFIRTLQKFYAIMYFVYLW